MNETRDQRNRRFAAEGLVRGRKPYPPTPADKRLTASPLDRGCGDCTSLTTCGGGCPGLRLGATPWQAGQRPLCHEPEFGELVQACRAAWVAAAKARRDGEILAEVA